ncbi:MAG: cupin domain-containing protein [Kiritimatiellales bacterium]|nr:cupin domain-containing protein [Kiritimatiellales bacterium]MCF7863415.1 cupin domain-containing protein [Kiritimatiellales bacterium]
MVESLFNNIFVDLPAELVSVLAENKNVRIERIVSDGHASPEGFWYDQKQNEWVMLVSGSAVLAFENGQVELKPGDHLVIPAHRRHRVESTSKTEKTIWLAVFYENDSIPV